MLQFFLLCLLQSRDVNTWVLGYPGPVRPTRVPWNQQSAQLQRSSSSKHWLPMWQHTDWTVVYIGFICIYV